MSTEHVRNIVDEMLSQGFSHSRCIQELVKAGISKEEAERAIVDVYHEWKSHYFSDDLEKEDLRAFHIELRLRLLESAIRNERTSVALAVLESLAQMQGVHGAETDDSKGQNLVVKLVPVAPSDSSDSEEPGATS